MQTKILNVSMLNNESPENTRDDIKIAAEVINKGGLVAFPTETVYGLGADALNAEAVKKIYKAKGRPSDNPMIVHIARASDIGQLTPMISADVVKIADSFWPGPLTVVLPKKKTVPVETTGGLDTVAIRIPDDPVALELIRLSDTPIAAPSANLSGKPSPTKAEHVIEDLNGVVDVILSGDDCRVGIESTVLNLTCLDTTCGKPVILRPGIITAGQIEAAIDREVILPDSLNTSEGGVNEPEKPKAPGMKYKHYSPKADMLIVEGQRDKVKSEIERLKGLNEKMGLKVGVILFEEQAFIEAAHNFFSELREMDRQGMDMILAGALSDRDGVGFAVMNRMMKSAGYNIVKV